MDDDRVGTVIADRYQLGRVLGRGGMGVVYEGTHKWTRRKLAVKVLKSTVARSDIALKRFFQEARAAAGLSHPNVVDVLDLGLDETGEAYIVLELLEGETLEALLQREGRLSPADTLNYLLPVLDALSLAHEHAIVHRDIKPANIVLSRDARGRLVPKLLDFGVAKLLARADPGTSSPMTGPGAMLGTVHYMAPEFVMYDDIVTPQCDIWSMGVMLYRCLSGVLPYDAPANTTVLVMIASTDHKPLHEVVPELPKPLCDAVQRALQRELDDRYKTINELVIDLMSAANQSGTPLTAASVMAARGSMLPASERPHGRDLPEFEDTDRDEDTIAD